MASSIKTPEEIEGMRVACRLGSEVLDYITPFIKPGVTTLELDRLAHDYMVNVQGTTPATLNYAPPGYPPFPGSICTSLNDVICHGIPGERVLKSGDALNIDITPITKDGYHGDNSRMFLVGEPSIMARRLSEITFECMWLGIAAVKPGKHLGDIGHAIQQHAEKNGYSVVREFCGHGVGRVFHEEPQVLHYGRPGLSSSRVPGHDLHHRADDQCRPPRHQGDARWLDHQDQGSQPVGAVGTHGAGDRDRGRGADHVGRQPATAGGRPAAAEPVRAGASFGSDCGLRQDHGTGRAARNRPHHLAPAPQGRAPVGVPGF
jgi:methionyl aminopeptidase